MATNPVTRPDCDLCVSNGRCELQGSHCRETLFAWADDRPAPECARRVISVRADVGFIPRTPSMVARTKNYTRKQQARDLRKQQWDKALRDYYKACMEEHGQQMIRRRPLW